MEQEIFLRIGSKIRARRQELRLTQMQVCSIIECDKRYYQKIESGKARITISTLQRIARALRAQVDFLLVDSVPRFNQIKDDSIL